MGGNRDYCSHISVAFEITGKFLIVVVRLILAKVGVDVFTGPRQESEVRQKIISTSHQGYKGGIRDFCSHFSVTFETTGKFLIVYVRLILRKVGVDIFTESRRESDVR